MLSGRILGWSTFGAGIGIHAVAWCLSTKGGAWATWFYQLAWWTYIVGAAGFLRIAGYPSALSGWRLLLMMPWSVVWWLLFDLANLRLRNWYYVLAPPTTPLRWIGFWSAFATVIPLTQVTCDILDSAGVFRGTRWRPFRVTPGLRRTLVIAGVSCVTAALAFPRFCYPLVWLFPPLLMEPWLERRPATSMLRRLSEGQPGILLRSLFAGLIVGFLWELFNHRAGAKWIYTVPGFRENKIFEMPLPGFLGFPPFAVATCSFWGVVATILRVPTPAAPPGGPSLRRAALLSCLLTLPLCIAGFAAIDKGTVRSFTPRPRDLPGWEPTLASRVRDPCNERIDMPQGLRERWCHLLRMARHRGMGLPRALELETLGIRSPQDLARCDPAALNKAWPTNDPPRPEELWIWIASARRGVPP